jgi:Kef-type K+ transport system membrane component KefB
MSFSSAAVVAAVALLTPLGLALTGLPLPSVVGEILLGIMVGPQASAEYPTLVIEALVFLS